MTFALHPKLEQDSHRLGKIDNSMLLLSRNAHFPWFLLVPETTEIELHKLVQEQQLQVLEQVNLISQHLEDHYPVDKLNIACIGNIVPQLHIHIVGRSHRDICWPGVVWGVKEHKEYAESDVSSIKQKLKQALGKKFHD